MTSAVLPAAPLTGEIFLCRDDPQNRFFRRVVFSSIVDFFDFTQLTQFSCPFTSGEKLSKAMLDSGDWKYSIILKTHIILKELFQGASKWKMSPFIGVWHTRIWPAIETDGAQSQGSGISNVQP